MFKKITLTCSLLLLICVLFYSSIASAVEPSIRFQHLTIENGLPQNAIYSVFQDSTGFLWLGTQDGLARYDGYNLKIFQHELNNVNSLSHNYITIIIEDRDGNLWLGTRGGGLNYFNTKSQQFTHYSFQANNANSLSHNDVWSIIEDNQGNLWLGTDGGLNHFNTKTQQFTRYPHQVNNPNSLSHNEVRSIVEDSQGNLWLGTRKGGLNYFNTKTQQFTHYRHQTNDSNSLSNNGIHVIVEDSQGNLWIGTEGGLNHFNTQKKQFSHYRHQVNNSNSLSDDVIYSITKDSQDSLWIGTGGGLNHFNIKSEQVIRYQNQSNNIHSLSDDVVNSIIEGSHGNLWVGTGAGLNHFNTKNELFNHYHHQANDPYSLSDDDVWSLTEDSQGDVWVSTRSGGLNHFNTKQKQFTHYRHQADNPNSLNSDNIRRVIEDKQGNLWIATVGGGLNHFNRKTQEFKHYRHLINEPNSLSDDVVWNILKDKQNNLWLATNSGLNYFNTKTQQFTRYRHQANDPNSLSHDNLFTMAEDKQGNIWIGTDGGGLTHFNTKKQIFTNYLHQEDDLNSLSNNTVNHIMEDSHSNLWIGTSRGLNLFNTKTKKFKRYNTENGLLNNIAYSIEEDNQGYIWISTNQGLTRMDPKTETFSHYDVGDGLQSNEFNSTASFKSKTGELFFGGIKGFNRFFPEKIIDDIQPPTVVITDMLLLNKSVPIISIDKPITEKNTHFSLTQAIHLTEAITLTHKDNIIAFEFSALHFSNAKKNQFAYQLVGWDENWVHTDYKNRRATYTNLPHGEYTFRVKASNADGYWNKDGTSLHITILPPPWKTWWAYTLFGLFLLSLVLAFINSQRKKVIFERHLNTQLENKVAERTAELQSTNTQLEELSLTDQLTGLRNRRYLQNNLQSDLDLILRMNSPSKFNHLDKRTNESDLIFFLIDLDHFKQVNDIHGHSAGDAVLIQIQSILEQVFRKSDHLVRWGGEEFLVVARFSNRDYAPKLAEKLRRTVEAHDFDIGQGEILKKTCSIGFACFPFVLDKPECLAWEQVIDIADHCMYAAKKSKRNSWVGLNNIDCSEDNLFSNITGKTQDLIELKKLAVESSITDKSRLKWD
ncbi:GGDEF domain-containing protein [Colwellia sp. 75C3]|uniref:ligand-binding sensor domain-containing protein n=1 Tax=Colwellia sp. 75C3 TaxID=888425 RepID=UPI000C34A1AE|nr:ligand-binding sensor domain-containing diguanylate cyclase [Colwellia sp. 75C3]PKG85110.1 GGDEF domain-containing protein [Colwellia sp. 75C3]